MPQRFRCTGWVPWAARRWRRCCTGSCWRRRGARPLPAPAPRASRCRTRCDRPPPAACRPSPSCKDSTAPLDGLRPRTATAQFVAAVDHMDTYHVIKEYCKYILFLHKSDFAVCFETSFRVESRVISSKMKLEQFRNKWSQRTMKPVPNATFSGKSPNRKTYQNNFATWFQFRGLNVGKRLWQKKLTDSTSLHQIISI